LQTAFHAATAITGFKPVLRVQPGVSTQGGAIVKARAEDVYAHVFHVYPALPSPYYEFQAVG